MSKVNDLSNQRFGKLLVIERVGSNGRGSSIWRCKCDCGNEKIISSSDLRSGRLSCGCLKHHKSPKYNDITGQKFGRLTVMYDTNNRKGGKVIWHCKCDCGNEIEVVGKHLRLGLTQSCGCLRIDKPNHTTHGMSKTPIYRKWSMMKTRCNNPKRDHYQWYGGKGIKICKEWHKFENFYSWAMENGYRDDLTIERIDINKDYEPSNCKWIPLKYQAYNKTNTHWITFNGKTQSLTEWSHELGWNPWVLKTRINKYHWSIEKALTTPLDANKWKSKHK